MKICTGCGFLRPFSDFPIRRASKDGLNYRCRSCVKEYSQRHYRENPELYSERGRKYYENNKDRYKEYGSRHYAEQRDKVLENVSVWARNNRDKVRGYQKTWRQNNPDQKNEWTRQRRALKINAPTIPFTTEQLAQKWAYWGDKCWVCGEEATQADHVKPLSKGGSHMLCNLRPICGSCNPSKSNKWPFDEWLVEWRARKKKTLV